MSDMNAAGHVPAQCTRKPWSESYSIKDWSAAFECPMCKREGRFSLSFLGERRVVCTGTKFVKERRS